MNSSDVPYTAGYALELLRDMLRIRRLEERAAELYGEVVRLRMRVRRVLGRRPRMLAAPAAPSIRQAT